MVSNFSLFWTFCFGDMGKVYFIRMDFGMKKGLKFLVFGFEMSLSLTKKV